MNYKFYVRVPREFGGEAHPRYWSVERVQEGTQRHTEIEQGWLINDAGEMVFLPASYYPVASKQAGERFIRAAWQRWKGD